jgi:hypothetical protein
MVSSASQTKLLHIPPVAVLPHYVERKRYASLLIWDLVIKLRKSSIVDELSDNGQTFIRVNSHQIQWRLGFHAVPTIGPFVQRPMHLAEASPPTLPEEMD